MCEQFLCRNPITAGGDQIASHSSPQESISEAS